MHFGTEGYRFESYRVRFEQLNRLRMMRLDSDLIPTDVPCLNLLGARMASWGTFVEDRAAGVDRIYRIAALSVFVTQCGKPRLQ